MSENTDILIGFTLGGYGILYFKGYTYSLRVLCGRQSIVTWHDLISWLWFLPTLLVGPIHRFDLFNKI